MDLNEWMKAEGLKQVEAATRLGISHGGLHNLITGRRKPSGRLAAKIEAVTEGKVRLADFYPE